MAAVAPRAQQPQRHDVAAMTGRTATLSPSMAAAPHHTPPYTLGNTSPSSSTSPASPRQLAAGLAKQLPAHVSKSQASPERAQQPTQLPLHQRPAQIGRPKPVSFVPAALRPTERPRASKSDGRAHNRTQSGVTSIHPPTPPRSLHSSTDSLPAAAANANAATPLNGGNNPARSRPGSRKSSGASSDGTSITTARQRPSRPSPLEIPQAGDGKAERQPHRHHRPTSSRASSILVSPTASLSGAGASSASLSSLAGSAARLSHPTRAHWKPDAMAPACDAPGCPTSFGTFVRRHHCRRCGGVFCYRHAGQQVPLDVDARLVRTCPEVDHTAATNTTTTASTTTTTTTSGPTSTPMSSSPSPSDKSGSSSGSGNGQGAASTPLESSPHENSMQDDGPVGWWRSCDACFSEWAGWMDRTCPQTAGVHGGLHEAGWADADAAAASRGIEIAGRDLTSASAERKTSVAAASVPRDWNWSTF